MEGKKTEELSATEADFVHLARFALTGKSADTVALLRRVSRRSAGRNPVLHDAISNLLKAHARPTLARSNTAEAIPVDLNSRLELLRMEHLDVPYEPIWPGVIAKPLNSVLVEREHAHRLREHGLHPTRSLLFTGPPGVGKTLAAQWLASKLGYPLYVLDLSAVMSSLLGRTGNNLRTVLDFAKRQSCVLLLDEFDAIAKRRDDVSEVGELKRLVTVLLQAIDEWPPSGLLIAATNHPELLDPAVWRRFDQTLRFALPDFESLEQAICAYLANPASEATMGHGSILATLCLGSSFSDAERLVRSLRRRSVIENIDLETLIFQTIQAEAEHRTQNSRIQLAVALANLPNVSQRKASELTNISRDTIRRHRDTAR